jgi:hypothetical protein
MSVLLCFEVSSYKWHDIRNTQLRTSLQYSQSPGNVAQGMTIWEWELKCYSWHLFFVIDSPAFTEAVSRRRIAAMWNTVQLYGQSRTGLQRLVANSVLRWRGTVRTSFVGGSGLPCSVYVECCACQIQKTNHLSAGGVTLIPVADWTSWFCT